MFRWIAHLFYPDKPEAYEKANVAPSPKYRQPRQRYAIVDLDGHIQYDVDKHWIDIGTKKGEEYLEYTGTIRTHKCDQMHIYRYIR